MFLLSCLVMVGSTLIALCSSNWLVAWLGMELNLMAFAVVITVSRRRGRAEAAAKYFLAQAFGSLVFLSAPLYFTHGSVSSVLIILALMVKGGMAPVHRWYPSVLSQLTWAAAFLLMTWQKLVPLLLLVNCASFRPVLLMVAGVNALVGALGALNQTHTLPILAYSSIGHMGWVLALLVSGSAQAGLYISVYLVILCPLLLTFSVAQSSTPKMAGALSEMGASLDVFAVGLLMSLAGLPPFSGFFVKGLAVLALVKVSLWLALWLIMCSALSLAFYLNLGMTVMLGPPVSARGVSGFPGYSVLSLLSLPAFVGLPLFPLLV